MIDYDLPPEPNTEPIRPEKDGGEGIWIAILMMAIILALALFGCATKYVPVEVTTTDSIVIRDTLVQVELVPYKDSTISIPIYTENDTSAVSFLNNPYAYSWARWDGRQLHHSLAIWPGKLTPIRVPYYTERVRRVEVPKVVEVEKELTPWQQLKLEVGGLAIGGCGVLLILLAWYIVRNRK